MAAMGKQQPLSSQTTKRGSVVLGYIDRRLALANFFN
jgi:hypothetical protein